MNHPPQIDASTPAKHSYHFHTGANQRASARRIRRLSGENNDVSPCRPHELRFQRQAQPGINDDPEKFSSARLASAVRKEGIVGKNRTYAS
jgi:hypothetical protein